MPNIFDSKEPICPSCGDVNGDENEYADERFDASLQKCYNCGCSFRLFVKMDVKYSTIIVKPEIDLKPQEDG